MQNKFKGILIALAIIFFFVFSISFYFIYKGIKNKEQNTEKILTQLQDENLRRSEIKTIMKSLQLIQNDNELLQAHFAKGSDLVPFLNTIDGLAPKIGGEDEIISVDITPEKNELVLGVRVLGSFESIYRFITLLENSSYEIEFLGVDIQKSGNMGTSINGKAVAGIKSEKTGKFYQWEGLLKIKLISFIP